MSYTNPNTLTQRFWKKVRKLSDNGCWVWTGGINGSGHGVIGYQDKLLGAHRASWIIHFGPIPENHDVVHTEDCQNLNCVAPHHLAARHGKTRPGKLNPEAVRQIRASTETQKALAERYGVTDSAISLVQLGHTWKHVA